MKRNVFEEYSSESDTEAPVKKPKPFTEPDANPPTVAVGSEAHSPPEEDYMNLKLEEDEPLSITELKPKPIETSILQDGSIGLSIMQKMGFKIGQTLGTLASGITEPIRVDVKKGRAGIGSRPKLPQDNKITAATIEEFRSHSKLKQKERSDLYYLSKLQRYCYEESGEDIAVSEKRLDLKDVNPLWKNYAIRDEKVPEARLALFDSAVEVQHTTLPELDTELDFDTLPLEEKLTLLIKYSRENYYYCAYCGLKFVDADDMGRDCPGPFQKDHAL